jgi:transcriptional regulator with XRE-family HTH domain
MPYQPAGSADIHDALLRFGAELRRCRLNAGMSQTQLAERSGVPQSTISRFERGLVPRAAMYKIVMLSVGLGHFLPLAYCPHDHRCVWGRLDTEGRPVTNPLDPEDLRWLPTRLLE